MIAAAGLVLLVALLFATVSHAEEIAKQRPISRRAALGLERGAKLKPVESPLPGVSDGAWTRYVRLMATGRPDTITTGGHVGIFGLGYRRLQDLGYVSHVRRTEQNGETTFEVEWAPPHSLEGFLADGPAQYEAFATSTRDHREKIIARHAGALGHEFAGKVATLSGLLAVAHQAGLRGLDSWLASEGDRQRYPHTTAAFIRATGLF